MFTHLMAVLLMIALAQTDGGTVALGQTVSGALGVGEEVRYLYSGTAGETITVTLRAASGDWDPVLEIYAPDGGLLAFDDDAGGGRDAAVRNLALPADGDYALLVRSYGHRSGGAYALTVERGTPPPTPVTGGGPMAFGQPASGELRQDGQRDLWTFAGEAGQQVTIAMESAWFDSFVSLNAPDGTEVVYDDDSGGDHNARIADFTLPQTGTYTIVARAWGDRGTGAYTLTLELGQSGAAPATAAPAGGGPIRYGATVAGRLAVPGQQDRWQFEAAAGDVVTITLASADFDSFLALFDAMGNQLVNDDDGAGGLNAAIRRHRLGQAGVYTIVARALGNAGAGAYTLTLELAGRQP